MTTVPAQPDSLAAPQLEEMGPELLVALETIIKTISYYSRDMERDLPNWSLFLANYAMALAEFLPEEEESDA